MMPVKYFTDVIQPGPIWGYMPFMDHLLGQPNIHRAKQQTSCLPLQRTGLAPNHFSNTFQQATAQWPAWPTHTIMLSNVGYLDCMSRLLFLIPTCFINWSFSYFCFEFSIQNKTVSMDITYKWYIDRLYISNNKTYLNKQDSNILALL